MLQSIVQCFLHDPENIERMLGAYPGICIYLFTDIELDVVIGRPEFVDIVLYPVADTGNGDILFIEYPDGIP